MQLLAGFQERITKDGMAGDLLGQHGSEGSQVNSHIAQQTNR